MNTNKLRVTLGILCLAVLSAAAVSAQEGGAFSTYLVGIYDQRDSHTKLQIVNPTAKDLELFIAFFDDAEKPLKCVKEKLSHNDLLEMDVKQLELKAKLGVVKIVSHRDRRPYPGIVGFQRHYFENKSFSESNLASVPKAVLDGEFKIILEVCK
jgi:hypothetical protein